MNPILKKLGFGPADRVAIVHADDFGMCQATIPAVAQLFDAGLVTSAAVMVPCPWFPAAAALCRERPELDIGVHTTLNCEWGPYRWGALTTSDPASGLVEPDGGLPRTTAAVGRADPVAVAAELRAQVERARAAGIALTHIDAHMGAAFEPPFLPSYLAIAREHHVPAFYPRATPELLAQRGVPPERAAALVAQQAELEAAGTPIVDHMDWMELRSDIDRAAMARRIFADLPPGLSYLILHPAVDTPELRAIAPDWRARVSDYELFMGAELRDYVRSLGVTTIGWRTIRDAL